MPLHTAAEATTSVLPVGAEALESYEDWEKMRDFRKALWRSRLNLAREVLGRVFGSRYARRDETAGRNVVLRARDEALWLELRERVREGRSVPPSARAAIVARGLARDFGPGPGGAEAGASCGSASAPGARGTAKAAARPEGTAIPQTAVQAADTPQPPRKSPSQAASSLA